MTWLKSITDSSPHAPLILVSVSWVDTFLTIVTPHPSTIGQLGRFVWEKKIERRHAHWRYSLHTLASVRVLAWLSSIQKEFCVTLCRALLKCVADDVGLLLPSGRRNQRLGYVAYPRWDGEAVDLRKIISKFWWHDDEEYLQYEYYWCRLG